MTDETLPTIPESTAVKFSRMMEDPELKAFLEPLLKDSDSDGDVVPDIRGVKAFFYKDGHFSKTATFAVLGDVLVLTNYALLSWFAGTVVDLSWIKLTIPAFDVGAAAAILGLLNGAYLTNNALKNKAGAAE
jgi:hypothetical protein